MDLRRFVESHILSIEAILAPQPPGELPSDPHTFKLLFNHCHDVFYRFYCFGNSVTASTKSNSCLLVSLYYYCRCICRTKCIHVFRTMIHRAMNTWETMTFIPHASQASQACQGRGGRERRSSPISIDLLKLFDVSFPEPLVWPLNRSAIVSTPNSCLGVKESSQTIWHSQQTLRSNP